MESLIKVGVNVVKFTFKYSTTEWHRHRIKLLKKVYKEKGLEVATLLDLQGPEIRITMPFEKIELDEGEKIIFSDDIFETKTKGFAFKTKGVVKYLKDDQQVSVDDGLFEFTVQKESGKTYLISYSSGTLLNNKSASIAGLDFNFPTIHDKDREGLVLEKRKE